MKYNHYSLLTHYYLTLRTMQIQIELIIQFKSKDGLVQNTKELEGAHKYLPEMHQIQFERGILRTIRYTGISNIEYLALPTNPFANRIRFSSSNQWNSSVINSSLLLCQFRLETTLFSVIWNSNKMTVSTILC